MQSIKDYILFYLYAREGVIDEEVYNKILELKPKTKYEAREMIRSVLNLN